MKKRSRNILVLLLAVCLAAVFSGSAFAALAPLNPEFVKWQQSGNVNKKNYITMKNGTKFLPGKIPSPLNWSHLNNLSWSVSARNSVRVDFPLPASYDLRPNMPAVKDQSDLGTCWTFSAAAATESNLIKKGLAASSDIKTGNWYLAYYGFHDESPSLPSFTNSTGELYFNVGGDDWQSVALLSRGTGSVSYDQARYPVNSADIYPPTLVKRTYKLTDALYLGNGEAREVQLVAAI